MSVLIFDGDDTLWSTEHLYDKARSGARHIVEDHGFDGSKWEAVERAVDVSNVARFGLSRERFPTSCVEALDVVAADEHRRVPTEVRELVRNAAREVFTAPAPLIDGAREVVADLATSYALALLTKGERDVQERRIDTSGLMGFFELVEIVQEKRPESFLNVVRQLDALPGESVSIGNSLSSDVWPASEAGLFAVWIDAHVWEYERLRADDRSLPLGATVASSLFDIRRALKRLVPCT